MALVSPGTGAAAERRPLERALAGVTHFSLYLLLIGVPLAGYFNAVAAGHAVSFFGFLSIPPLIPENDRLSQIAIAVHLGGQYLVYLFVAMHLAGALLHGLVKRDRVLERMLPVRRSPKIGAAVSAMRARRPPN